MIFFNQFSVFYPFPSADEHIFKADFLYLSYQFHIFLSLRRISGLLIYALIFDKLTVRHTGQEDEILIRSRPLSGRKPHKMALRVPQNRKTGYSHAGR